MSTTLQTIEKIKKLTTPFPQNNVVKEWKNQGRRILGYFELGIPEEIIHAANMLPFRVSGDNDSIPMLGIEGYFLPNSSSIPRTAFQLVLDGKYDFLDGLTVSIVNEASRRIYDNWLAYKPLPYMDTIYLPLKRTEDALQMYQADLEDWRSRVSEFRGARIIDRDLQRAIQVYNKGRDLMQKLYLLRQQDKPPVTGAESLEIIKSATRLPREQFNQLLEELLDEIQHTHREIKKEKRLMILGSTLHNSTWIKGIEENNAIVVTDEIDAGTRYFWGKVNVDLPPMEALARYYIFERPPGPRIWPSGERFKHIFDMVKKYNVDGVISEIVRFDAEYGHDKIALKKEMDKRGIPILELDLEYGEGNSEGTKTRIEAFLEVLQNK